MEMKTVQQRILTAAEGMYLTDGQTAGKTVVLPAAEDYSAWREITEAEYKEMTEAQSESNV